MKALLLIAHGSRVGASNDEVRRLAEQLRAAAAGRFDLVECAFLELAEPSIPDGVQRCIAAGADEVFVVPYFLSGGRHVTEDVPAALRPKRDEHPHVRIHLCDYLGKAEAITDSLLELAERRLA